VVVPTGVSLSQICFPVPVPEEVSGSTTDGDGQIRADHQARIGPAPSHRSAWNRWNRSRPNAVTLLAILLAGRPGGQDCRPCRLRRAEGGFGQALVAGPAQAAGADVFGEGGFDPGADGVIGLSVVGGLFGAGAGLDVVQGLG
jgi:hypothetical protein